MQYNTVRYSTLNYSTVQYITVRYSTVQYIAVQYITLQYGAVQYISVQYSTVSYVKYCVVLCRTVRIDLYSILVLWNLGEMCFVRSVHWVLT